MKYDRTLMRVKSSIWRGRTSTQHLLPCTLEGNQKHIMFDAASILRSSSIGMIVIGAVTFLACSIIAAPYGRYSTARGWGFLVPAKLSWFIMESPNLLMPPLIYGYFGSPDCFNSRPNTVLLGMFLMHYFHRSIIYPLFRVNGRHHKATPVTVTILAFSYCSWNGFNQALALLVVNIYPWVVYS